MGLTCQFTNSAGGVRMPYLALDVDTFLAHVWARIWPG